MFLPVYKMNSSWPKPPHFLSSVIAKQVQLQRQRIFQSLSQFCFSFYLLFIFFNISLGVPQTSLQKIAPFTLTTKRIVYRKTPTFMGNFPSTSSCQSLFQKKNKSTSLKKNWSSHLLQICDSADAEKKDSHLKLVYENTAQLEEPAKPRTIPWLRYTCLLSQSCLPVHHITTFRVHQCLELSSL